jgi:hypothetical protein
MYQLFTAGVTCLIALYQAHANAWRLVDDLAGIVMALQNCMSTMEALAGEFENVGYTLADDLALTPGTSAILNAFENVSQKIIRHITSSNGAFSVPTSPMRVDNVTMVEQQDPMLNIQDFLDLVGTGNQQMPEMGGGNIPDPNLVFDDMWQQMLNPNFEWDTI